MERCVIDVEANRKAIKYSKKEMLWRVCWGTIGKPLMRFSLRPMFSWRRVLLRCFGAKVGKKVNVYPTTIIYYPWKLIVGDWSAIAEDVLIYNLGKVEIGEKVTISHRAHLCAGTHDYKKIDFPLIRATITVKDQVWICSQAFIGPGVTIGEGAIIGAASVVMNDVEPWTIVAGNPAKKIRDR